MENKNPAIGLFGAFISSVSLVILVLSILGLVAIQALALIYPAFLVNAQFFIVIALVAFVGVFYGAKLYFENAHKLAKLYMGFAGLVIMFIGVGVAIIGAPVAPIAILGTLILIAVGLKFVEHGWGVNALKVLKSLWKMIR